MPGYKKSKTEAFAYGVLILLLLVAPVLAGQASEKPADRGRTSRQAERAQNAPAQPGPTNIGRVEPGGGRAALQGPATSAIGRGGTGGLTSRLQVTDAVRPQLLGSSGRAGERAIRPARVLEGTRQARASTERSTPPVIGGLSRGQPTLRRVEAVGAVTKLRVEKGSRLRVVEAGPAEPGRAVEQPGRSVVSGDSAEVREPGSVKLDRRERVRPNREKIDIKKQPVENVQSRDADNAPAVQSQSTARGTTADNRGPNRHGTTDRDHYRFAIGFQGASPRWLDYRGSQHVYARSHPGVGYGSERIFQHIVWPGYYYTVYYNYGPTWTFRCIYPYYHRKYVFVSLGGYWPADYRYQRYYWYGCHPFFWYGFDPVVYPVAGNTYNYYIYNNYGQDYGLSQPLRAGEVVGGVQVPDYDSLSKVRDKAEKEKPAEPAAQTRTDDYFEEAVKAFEQGDYDAAAGKLRSAMALESEDIVLPFAYAQALFADGEYAKAASTLREALKNVDAEKQGVFFPRGLYPEENILSEQIDRLAKEVAAKPSDAELQLLMGYQLLGVGEYEKASEHLCNAQQDEGNSSAATVLLKVTEKLKQAEQQPASDG